MAWKLVVFFTNLPRSGEERGSSKTVRDKARGGEKGKRRHHWGVAFCFYFQPFGRGSTRAPRAGIKSYGRRKKGGGGSCPEGGITAILCGGLDKLGKKASSALEKKKRREGKKEKIARSAPFRTASKEQGSDCPTEPDSRARR